MTTSSSLLGGIVEREQVVEPTGDDRLLVVCGYHDGDGGLDRPRLDAARAHTCERIGRERVEQVRPEERAQGEPEKRLDQEHVDRV